MKKNLIAVCAIALAMTALLSGCCMHHEWQDATCAVPQTCSKCGKTKGEPTEDHTWQPATCTEPKTCSVCGATEGEALGHSWLAATCTDPKTCTKCLETEGDALGHNWEEATCEDPKTCKRCGETEGEALGHEYGDWEVTVEATSTTTGLKERTCERCGDTQTQTIDKVIADGTVAKFFSTYNTYAAALNAQYGYDIDTIKISNLSSDGAILASDNCMLQFNINAGSVSPDDQMTDVILYVEDAGTSATEPFLYVLMDMIYSACPDLTDDQISQIVEYFTGQASEPSISGYDFVAFGSNGTYMWKIGKS